MVESEREWLLAKIGLIPEMDDDVMWVPPVAWLMSGTSKSGPAVRGCCCDIWPECVPPCKKTSLHMNKISTCPRYLMRMLERS